MPLFLRRKIFSPFLPFALVTGLVLAASTAFSQPAAPLPAKEPPPPPVPADLRIVRDIQYGKAGDVPLLLHLVVSKTAPASPLPIIVIVHGGGWGSGTRDSRLAWAYRFAQNGFIAATIDYRLSQQAPFPAQIQDSKCAIRFLRCHAAEYQIDPDRIGAMGDSAGGHLVTLLGLTENVREFDGDSGWSGVSCRVQAVCDWFGPSDILAWAQETDKRYAGPANSPGVARLLGGAPLEHPDRAKWASPMTYLAQSENVPPFFIAHGDHDATVPLQQSLTLGDALQGKGVDVTFRLNLNGQHGSGSFGKAIWPDMLAFFDRTLRGKATGGLVVK